MRKLLLVVFSLALLGFPTAQARNSAASFDNKYYSQQEFVQAYNSSTAPMYRDYIVGLDTNATGASTIVNPNVSLGQYITEQTGATTDNIYVFGVVDETIPAGQLGRIAIRGPHKVVTRSGAGIASWQTVGTPISQCASNVPQYSPSDGIAAHAQNGGLACPYSTATGTAGSQVGVIINATATTDTGDVGVSTNAQNDTTQSEYWAWINPQVLR